MSLTPEQFDKLVTKDYLNEILNERFGGIPTKEDFRGIVNTLDYIVKKLDKIDTEQTANIAAHDRFTENVNNLDLRVTKLEGATV